MAARQRIVDWLEKLGMSEYTERFIQNDFEISALRDLTDQDFKDLGVSLGHRRKMLRDCGAFRRRPRRGSARSHIRAEAMGRRRTAS